MKGILQLSILCPTFLQGLSCRSPLVLPPPTAGLSGLAGTPVQRPVPHLARALSRLGMPFAIVHTVVAKKRKKACQHQGANYSFISSQCISLSALCFSVQC